MHEAASASTYAGDIELKELNRMLRMVLLIFVILLVIGSLPSWPYSTGWGYYPAGGFGLLLVVLLLAVLMSPRRL
jgi:hypothetical protein